MPSVDRGSTNEFSLINNAAAEQNDSLPGLYLYLERYQGRKAFGKSLLRQFPCVFCQSRPLLLEISLNIDQKLVTILTSIRIISENWEPFIEHINPELPDL